MVNTGGGFGQAVPFVDRQAKVEQKPREVRVEGAAAAVERAETAAEHPVDGGEETTGQTPAVPA